MELPVDSPLLRIGELSRRLGVSDPVLQGRANRCSLPQLQRNGRRIGYPGAATPAEALEWAVDGPHLDPAVLAEVGATEQIATAAGARLMAGDPATEAERAGWSR